MSRRLINGRDWRRLVAVIAGVGFKHYFSNTGDNSDVVTQPLCADRRSIVRNWEDRYVDDYRKPMLWEDANLFDSEQASDSEQESDSSEQASDSEQESDGILSLINDVIYDALFDSACESSGDSDMVMNSLSCSKGFDGLQYLDDVFTRRAADLGFPPRPGNAATLFKTGMLSDPDNGTSMVQGANVYQDKKTWEIVWFTSTGSTTARASSGFCCVPSVSSQALGQFVQYAGFSKVWSPHVTLAMA